MPVDPGVAVQVNPEKPRPKPKPLPASTVAPKGQSPQGPSPLTTPHEPPHPVLHRAGIQSGVQGLNQKVDALTAAHTQAFGTRPAPGLILDVLRSNIPVDQFPLLFNIPKNQNDKAARQAVQQHKALNPDDYFVHGPASVQPDTPLYRAIRQTATPNVKPGALPVLQAKYPMVMMGALPVSGNLLGEIENAVQHLNQPGPIQAPSPDVSLEQKYAFGSQGAGAAGSAVGQDYQRTFRTRAVTGIVEAKQELQRQSGIAFSDGPVFNQDDQAKLAAWMHTADYFKTQLAFQAKGANQTVAQYVKSWNAKWGKNSVVHNGLVGHFMQAMPQQLWGHGGFWGDLLSIPGFLKGQSNNPLNILLHGLTRTAGLGLNAVGGTVSQAKADLAAGTTFAVYMASHNGPAVGPGTPSTFEQALDKSREQLRANPSWLRLAAGGYLPTHEGATLARIDAAVNVAGDLILLRKPGFTGERVAAGDLAGALGSDYLRAASSWAFKDLQAYGRDGIGRAASRLDGGQGARAIVARAAKLVSQGKMSENEFTRRVAELFSQGSTEIAGKTVEGPLLASLRTAKLPTPGPLGRGWLQAKAGIRGWLDRYDAGATGKYLPGTDQAVSFVDSLRSAVAHAAPEGAKIGTSQRILPEQVFNFVRKYKLTDNAGANRLESQLVRYQGTGNVQGIQSVQQQLRKLWDDRFPGKEAPSDEPFRAQISTENPSVFHFPGQADPKLETALDSIHQAARTTNAALNKAAKIHARIILSGLNPLTGLGGFSLFWKHAIGDGLRAGQAGVATLLTPETRRALSELDRLATSDVSVERELGAFLDRTRTGETRWALSRRAGDSQNFRTGDHLLPEGSPANVFRKRSYLDAAGGYLRRHLTAVELQGYRDGNLVDVILRDREARAAWKSHLARNPDLTASEHAGNVAKEYQEIEAALQQHGLTFDDALNALRASRGHEADAGLGRFIQEHQLDFPVRGGLVENASPFDELTSRWVGNVIMRPNKIWRSSLARAVLGKHYAEFRKAGWDDKTAFRVAADTAEQVVKFHMLDFANRLQVEQDLRWVSYFATKHRLYWKWVNSTFLRHPGYAAAVADFKQTLDSTGGWTLPFKLLGSKWQIPLERLVWVPGREYDETSPLALIALDYVKAGFNLDAVAKDLQGGNGNILTRSDVATKLGTKLLKIERGDPATYGYAVAGLDKSTHDKVWRAINEYQQQYFKDHGHYAPETHAVKVVLLQQMGQEYWHANLPLPIVPETGTSDAQQKLIVQYETLRDPGARRKFLDDHPGFSDHFGIYDNPKLKIHNDTLFRRWNVAVDAYRQARAHLFEQAKASGEWTVPLEKQRRALSAALERTRNQLLLDDAHQWGIDTHGLVPNGDTVPYGPWGKVVNKDPTFDPSHVLSAIFPKLATAGQDNVIGPLQKQMRQELSLLNDPKYVASSNYTPDEVRTRKRELLQSLDVFKSYPTDALGVIRDQYQTKFVNPYWKRYDSRFKAIAALPSDQRKTGDAAFRAWRDSQDRPVIVDGVAFPSPPRMAWATLPPQTRKERLGYLSAKPLSDLADYELDLLGVKHPANVSAALSGIETAVQQYRAQNHASVGKAQLVQVAKQIDKQAGYHGFYSYYQRVLTQPRLTQFELTSVYREMPAPLRSKFDTVIGSPAIQLLHRIAAGKDKSYYRGEWRRAMEAQITPWLNEPDQAPLKAYLAPLGPNFLNTLVSGG